MAAAYYNILYFAFVRSLFYSDVPVKINNKNGFCNECQKTKSKKQMHGASGLCHQHYGKLKRKKDKEIREPQADELQEE